MAREPLEATALVRRALAGFDEVDVLTHIDALALQTGRGADVLILVPLRQLKKSRAYSEFVRTAPPAAAGFVLEMMTEDALARVVELLGESANEPTFDELAGAIDQMLREGVPGPIVAGMCAAAYVHHVPASEHCRRLLEERDVLALPELPEPIDAAAPLSAHVVSPEIREQRRRRREEQKLARQRNVSRPPVRPSRPTRGPSAPTSRPERVREPEIDLSPTRRAVTLTPREAADFTSDHPLAGWVVEIDVPFVDDSIDVVGSTSKVRPAVVLAGADTSLLVLPIFTRVTASRILLAGWQRLGLDHASYVDHERMSVDVGPDGVLRRFGRLNDVEWNALL